MFPIDFTWPFKKPRSVFGLVAIGASWAIGLPRFVITMGSPLDATSSIAWRHRALNSLARIVFAIGSPCDHVSDHRDQSRGRWQERHCSASYIAVGAPLTTIRTHASLP